MQWEGREEWESAWNGGKGDAACGWIDQINNEKEDVEQDITEWQRIEQAVAIRGGDGPEYNRKERKWSRI